MRLSLLLLGCIACHAATLLILEKGVSALAFYSTNGQVIATVPVGQHPHELVFSADRKLLYTSDNGTMRIEHPGQGGNSLSVIDLASRRKIADIPLGNFRRPHGMDLDPETGHLVVTTESPDQLILVDTKSRGIIRTFETKGKTSHMVTFGPGAKWAYVSNSTSNTISAIRLKTGEVKIIPTAKRPEGSVLSKDGKELYVCNRDESMISVISTESDSQVAIIRTGAGPVRIALTPDGSRLIYALMQDKKIGIADPKARKQLDYILLPASPVSLHLSPDGTRAFASAEEQDTVYVVDLKSRHIEKEIKTPPGAGPDPVVEIP